MFCTKCSNELMEGDFYCSKCGCKINESDIQVNVSSNGDSSPNIGNGIGNKVEIDNFYNGYNNKKVASYDKETGNIQIKKSTITITKFVSLFSGIIGFIASILTIIDFEVTSRDKYVPIIMMLSIILFSVSIFLFTFTKKMKDEEFVWIKIYWWMPNIIFDLSDDKSAYRIVRKINGICPKCGNDLIVRKDVDSGKISGVCIREKTHRYRFEYISLTGKEYEVD